MVLVLLMGKADGQSRAEAVRAAREGRTEDAIRALQSIVANDSKDTGAALDLSVILTWAKRPRDATDVFERAAVAEPPENVLLAMARAYRDQERFGLAQQLAEEGLRRFPHENAWPVLNALLAGDIALASGDYFGALRAYSNARQLGPDEGGIAAVMGGILMRLNAPYAAASMLSNPDLGIQAGEAAKMVRWGLDIVPSEPTRRFEQTDAALARLEVLIQEASVAHPVDRRLITRLKRDRVLALRNRERWNDAVQSAAALRADGDVLPPYVREAEADSLLALRRPEQALEIYKEVLAADPRNRDARQGLLYAQVETEDFNAAFVTADTMVREEQPAIRLPRMPGPKPNPEWLDANVLAALARHYATMNSEAWKRMQPLANGAPALGYLRSALGSVAAGRGWPRRADEEIEIAAELAPEDRGIQIALAESCLRRKRFREARRRAEQLNLLYPGDVAVQRLQRDVATEQAVELQSNTVLRHESGNASNRPGSEVDTSARLYLPPFDERWRPFAEFNYSSAKPVEGTVNRIRYGAGAQAEWPDFTLEAIAWNNAGALSRGGASLAGTWEATDQWSFSASGELFSAATPLRAVLHGITANGASFRTSYAGNESVAISARMGALLFSDGNQRLEGSVSLFRRLTDRPHLKLSIHPEVYASHNTRLDAPYFNPQHDASANLAFEVDHVLWRRYERSFRQNLTLGAGPYWEAHFRPDWLGQISYRQTYQLQPGLEIRYGLDFARRVYDGQPVRDVGIVASVDKRFGV
jgi:biofilm PGA synthesis protein PgaA